MADKDVSLQPNFNADPQDVIAQNISKDIFKFYDVYSYRHAAGILRNSYPEELAEIEQALLDFSLTQYDIGIPGGNESDIPKKFSRTLRPLGWVEARVQGDLIVRVDEFGEELLENGKTRKHKLPKRDDIVLENFIDGHKIDYVKGKVALDVEWNSKDQTYDRDLYAFRAFHDTGVISVAILITRSEKLNPAFSIISQLDKQGNVVMDDKSGKPKSVKAKYGASTTWMGKLIYRLNANRNGACPVLVFGIRPELITDLDLNGE